MNLVPLLVAAIAVLPVFTLAAWVWFAMAGTSDDLGPSPGFEGMHFDE